MTHNSADDLKNMILNIRNNVYIVHADYSESGIHKQPTIYLWTFLNSEKNVEKIVNKLYPNTFCLFVPERVYSPKYDNKIILKINKTNSEIPVIHEDQRITKKYTDSCIIT